MAKLNIDDAKLQSYMLEIAKDYRKWYDTASMEYEADSFIVGYDVGSGYIRVWTAYKSRRNPGELENRSSHSFIVNKAGVGAKKWPLGEILKCASWKAPAQNFSRGSILRPKTFVDKVRWTGW